MKSTRRRPCEPLPTCRNATGDRTNNSAHTTLIAKHETQTPMLNAYADESDDMYAEVGQYVNCSTYERLRNPDKDSRPLSENHVKTTATMHKMPTCADVTEEIHSEMQPKPFNKV